MGSNPFFRLEIIYRFIAKKSVKKFTSCVSIQKNTGLSPSEYKAGLKNTGAKR